MSDLNYAIMMNEHRSYILNSLAGKIGQLIVLLKAGQNLLYRNMNKFEGWVNRWDLSKQDLVL